METVGNGIVRRWMCKSVGLVLLHIMLILAVIAQTIPCAVGDASCSGRPKV